MLKLPLLPPRLPAKTVRTFVETHLRKRKILLRAYRKNPQAAWVFDRESLAAAAQKFRAAFAREFPAIAFFYAIKCNPHPLLLENLTAQNWSLDTSSGEELASALETSAPQILLSGPGKTDAELRLAAHNAARVCVLADSLTELARLKDIGRQTRGSGGKIAIGARIAVSPDWKKFGVELRALENFYRETADRNLDFCGLQFHTSWNLTPDAPVKMLAKIGEKLAKMPRDFIAKIKFIDCGGGYWIERGEWLTYAGTARSAVAAACGIREPQRDNPLKHYYFPAAAIAEFAQAMARAFARFVAPVFAKQNLPLPKIYVEPGRWLATPALHLLLTVNDLKNPQLAITDAGTNARGLDDAPAIYAPIINLTRPSLRERRAEILGSLCTPRDWWGASYFGESLRAGDVLLIPEQGAYTYALRQAFIKPLLPTISI